MSNGSPGGIGNTMIWGKVDDVVLTVIAVLFPIFNDKPHGGTGQWLEVIFMIFSHGLYHKYLTLLNCPAIYIYIYLYRHLQQIHQHLVPQKYDHRNPSLFVLMLLNHQVELSAILLQFYLIMNFCSILFQICDLEQRHISCVNSTNGLSRANNPCLHAYMHTCIYNVEI